MNTASNVPDFSFDESGYKRAMDLVRAGSNGVMHVECFEIVMGAKKRGAPWVSKYASRCNYVYCQQNGGNVTAGAKIGRIVRELFEAKMPRTPRTPRAARQAIDLDGDTNDSFPDYTGETATKEETTSFAAKLAPSGTDAANNVVVQALAAMLLPQIKGQIEEKLSALDPETLINSASKTLSDTIERKTAVYDELVSDLLSAAEKRIAELSMPQTLEIKNIDTGVSVNVGHQHPSFPDLLAVCSIRRNAWIAGPAGSGKSFASKAVALALGLRFAESGAIYDSTQLSGYMSASGDYVPTVFHDFYKNGGVYLLDECDGSEANATLWLQGALDNGHAQFPHGMVERHPDFVCIASANTNGGGSTHEYVGRNRLDAAFLDRFLPIPWALDEEFERQIMPNLDWTKRVQALRSKVLSRGLKVMITPRASRDGAKLLAIGMTQSKVEEITIGNKMTPEQWRQVSA